MVRIVAAVLSLVGLGLGGMATPAQATDHYIVFVNYYSDSTHTVLVGSRTFNHTTESELCP